MKRHFVWIGELFIWLLILSVLAGGIMFARYNYRKNFNTYQIFLPDVDGLINGSPVKFMGIQVGYVNQIAIVGDNVYVKFLVTEKNIKIPPSSIATVEFSGLGGSKSLELYPPNTKSKAFSDMLIIPQAPKRIHDSLGLLMDMFDKVAEIAYTASNFMNEIGIIKSQNKNTTTVNFGKLLDDSNDWLENAHKGSLKFGGKIDDCDKKLKDLE